MHRRTQYYQHPQARVRQEDPQAALLHHHNTKVPAEERPLGQEPGHLAQSHRIVRHVSEVRVFSYWFPGHSAQHGRLQLCVCVRYTLLRMQDGA